jgi:inositol phosphorylceramide mannosyltransferase catalytic subunit
MLDAIIKPVERDHRMYEGEARAVYVEVTNGTGETWPGGMETEPLVRLSYHLRSAGGEVLQADGPRSPLTAPLAPGESQIVPVMVEAPEAEGRYLLEIDVVHEHVRWFDVPAQIELEVVPAGRCENNVPRLRRLPRRMRIPRVLHQVWVGSKPMPDEHREFVIGWQRRHPDWQHRLWTDADLPELDISPELVQRAVTPSELSDLVRYTVVARHGGVYIDTDVECLRPIDPVVRGLDAFAGCSKPGIVATGVFGAIPGHPAIARAAELARRFVGARYPETTAGPILLTHVVWDFPDFTIYPPELFTPYLWDEPHRRDERFEGAYAVHHWTLSWKKDAARKD